ncbi:MAG TPA: hypothetical protein VJZ76_22255 [Thermoanaerobaculia bacterium]|nr:hypothetical protein [Thermoanaerobaculia bacterium]
MILFAALPLAAQTADDRVSQLEKRLDTLTQEVAQIRQEIDKLKGAPASAPAPAADTEDLTKVDVAPAAQPTPQPSAPSLADVQTVNNVVNPAASKVFNPDTSVIGNFLGHFGQYNPADPREPFRLDEAEVSFQAFIDPYAKGNFFLSVTPEGIDVEEGYAQFVTLPWDLTAKAGKFKAMFGKANTWHTHTRPWVDQPLVIHNFFGDEQFHGDGLSVSKALPNSFAFVEATGEVYSGEVDGIFERQRASDLAWNTHLKAFKDITESSNVEVGTSWARGTIANGHSAFGGVDVTYRWKPLQQGLYRGLIARVEGIANKRDDTDRTLRGFYASLDYQLAQRWFTGVRIDSADEPPRLAPFGPARDRGVSATLTFWPSEFSQIRGQLRSIRYGDVKTVNELLLQLEFAIGAHGAHAF